MKKLLIFFCVFSAFINGMEKEPQTFEKSSTNISGGFFSLNNFLKQNKKQPSLQYFPLEELPKDIQDEIASYLPFEFKLINRLNNPRKTKSSNGGITFEKNALKVKISPNRKNVKIEFNKSETIKLWNKFWNKNKPQEFDFDFSLPISDAEVSPDFKKIILILEQQQSNILHMIHLDSLPYFGQPLDTNKKIMNIAAVSNDGNAIAYSDFKDIYYDYRDKPETCLKSLDDNLIPIILEFNKQGTKLGVKYKNGKTEIFPVPENLKEDSKTQIASKNEKKKTLEEYFRRNLIKNKLYHYASSLDELD